ncbi:hypothetical protein [Streptomyces sp. Da 82-17]|uniref:hypothetical protein n=1 Tax=Streptomyces sp. Da 82-17 TaxID=3377116 RepID=UPI0038D4E0E1
MEAELVNLARAGATTVVQLVTTGLFTWAMTGVGKVRELMARDGGGDAAGTEPSGPDLERLVRELTAAHEAGDREAVEELQAQLAAALEELLHTEPERGADAVRELVQDGDEASAHPELRPNTRHRVNHDALHAELEEHWAKCRAADVPAVMGLVGLRGSGRRTACRRFTSEHLDYFSGPVLTYDLGRTADGRHADPATVLDTWLHQLDAPPQERAGTLDAKSAAFRRACARAHRQTGPVVVILENAETRAQIEPLLPGTPGSAVLITCEQAPARIGGAPDFRKFRVPPLEVPHRVELIGSVSELDLPPERLHRLAVSVGGSPWSLRMVAASLEPTDLEMVDDLAEFLAHRSTRQEFFTMDHDDRLHDDLTLAYGRLGPKAAQLYRLLGLLPGGRVTLDTLYALLPAWSGLEVRSALRELRNRSVVERPDEESCRLEPLVHDHALSRAEQDEEDGAREDLRDRFFAYVLEWAERAESALSLRWLYAPQYVPPLRGRAAEARPYAEGAAQQARAEGEFASRRDTLVPAVLLAHATGRHRQAWLLCQASWSFYLRTRSHAEWIESHRAGLAAAQECGDLLAVARMRFQLGFAHLDRWSLDEDDPRLAWEHFETALGIVREGERDEARRRTESSVLEAMGLHALKLKHAQRALDHFEEARAALGGVDHPRGRALLTFHTARAYTALNRHNDAEHAFVRAREEFENLPYGPDRFNVAKTWLRQAEDRIACGQLDAALAHLDRADQGMEQLAATYQLAEVRLLRGRLHAERSDPDAARADWESARELFARRNSARADEVRQLLDRLDER